LFIAVWALPELIEAAIRSGNADLAPAALERLVESYATKEALARAERERRLGELRPCSPSVDAALFRRDGGDAGPRANGTDPASPRSCAGASTTRTADGSATGPGLKPTPPEPTDES